MKKKRPKGRGGKSKEDLCPTGMGDVRIERVAVEKLKPAPYNPRVSLKPGDPAYEKLKRSIAEFGSVDPLVWNKRTGHLVGGHQRFTVLLNEHLVPHVDVSVVDLPLEREKALNVALNKIVGEWDDPALASLLAELEEGGTDATLTGFDLAEIEHLLASAQEPDPDTEPQFRPPELRVVVLCDKGERQQRRLIARLEREGYTCQAVKS